MASLGPLSLEPTPWPLRGKGLSRVTSPVFGNGTFLAAGQIANSCREPLFRIRLLHGPGRRQLLARTPGSCWIQPPPPSARGRFLVLGARWQMPESGCIPVSAADWAALSPNGRDWTESALPPAPASARWAAALLCRKLILRLGLPVQPHDPLHQRRALARTLRDRIHPGRFGLWKRALGRCPSPPRPRAGRFRRRAAVDGRSPSTALPALGHRLWAQHVRRRGRGRLGWRRR